MKIVGLMSGTSLDGLDIILTEISEAQNTINYNILKADTISYPDELLLQLSKSHKMSGYELTFLHKNYGRFLGKNVKKFLGNDSAEYIASHGHTVFHNPDRKLSLQIGDGAFIAAESGINTISDFRNIDLALGGQGAPLVPIGDKLLFSEYDACLNIGGFVNISFDEKGIRRAFDVCPGNRAANRMAAEKGVEYDNKGLIGSSGKLNHELLQILNSLDYYKQTGAKSLGREWDEQNFMTIFENFKHIPVNDRLFTLYEHIAERIADCISFKKSGKMLVTGGGAYNNFLIDKIQSKLQIQIVIPNDILIQYKEALIFALLGFLRVHKRHNILASYTGASQNSSGGIIHYV